MKILFTMRLCSRELGVRLAADPLLAKALKPVPNAAVGFLFPKAFDAAGPVLPRLLELAESERLSLLRDMQFSPAELDQASHLEVICKLTIGQTPADVRATQAAYAAEGLHPTASRWRVRLPQRIFLGKPATGELLPAALEDATRIETFDNGRGMPSTPRRYGLLSYAGGALAGSPDFARTAEPFGAWCTPLWVVRQPVRQWFTGAGLRGWGFWPVLQEGSELHGQHTQQWQQALSILQGGGAEVAV